MNNKQQILKIEDSKGKILLSSIDAAEELSHINDFKIVRSINDEPINVGHPIRTKYKLTVKTNDLPDISVATIGELFKIYSTVCFRCHKNSQDRFQKIQESLEKNGDYVTFRPVFSMYLINHRITPGEKSSCNLMFEEG